VTAFEHAVVLDIWLMSLLGGKPRETLSSAAYNAHVTGRFFGFTHHFIDLMFYVWERDHCKKDWFFRQHIYAPGPRA
jgi:hypothetical protein